MEPPAHLSSRRSQATSLGAENCIIGENWAYTIYLVFGLVSIVCGLSAYGIVFSRMSFKASTVIILKGGGIFLVVVGFISLKMSCYAYKRDAKKFFEDQKNAQQSLKHLGEMQMEIMHHMREMPPETIAHCPSKFADKDILYQEPHVDIRHPQDTGVIQPPCNVDEIRKDMDVDSASFLRDLDHISMDEESPLHNHFDYGNNALWNENLGEPASLNGMRRVTHDVPEVEICPIYVDNPELCTMPSQLRDDTIYPIILPVKPRPSITSQTAAAQFLPGRNNQNEFAQNEDVWVTKDQAWDPTRVPNYAPPMQIKYSVFTPVAPNDHMDQPLHLLPDANDRTNPIISRIPRGISHHKSYHEIQELENEMLVTGEPPNITRVNKIKISPMSSASTPDSYDLNPNFFDSRQKKRIKDNFGKTVGKYPRQRINVGK